MMIATTDPAHRAAVAAARRERSLAAWRLLAAVGALPAHLFAGHEKGAAPEDGPAHSLRCAA